MLRRFGLHGWRTVRMPRVERERRSQHVSRREQLRRGLGLRAGRILLAERRQQLVPVSGSAALCIDGGAPCYEGSNVSGPPPGNGWTEISCLCGDNCGHGYFCHTACDACIDDGDCGDQETCNYDVVKHIWACSECLGIP
jgi:hypothetical protein